MAFEVYGKVLADISRKRPLTATGYRVFMCLLGFEDDIPGFTVIGNLLGIARQHVYTAFIELLDNGYLLRDDKGYRMHPLIAFNGSEPKREVELKKLSVVSCHRMRDEILAEAEKLLEGR